MPAVAVSGDPIVVVVDVMELRRALVVHFLKDWAAAEKVEIFSFAPNDAHLALREGIDCRMIIFNAGAALCSSADTLAEVKVLRVLAPSASLVFLADEEIPEEVATVMRSGAEGYLSNGSSPDLALRALSFVLKGGTYFPRSAVAHPPFPEEPSLRGKAEMHAAAVLHEVPGTAPVPATAEPLPSSQLPELSTRQKAILEGLCRGEPNKIIGRALNLPESTVKVHVREIMRKLSVTNRTQVAVVVGQMGSALNEKPTLHLDLCDRFGGDKSPVAVRGVHAPPICPTAPVAFEKMRAIGNKANGGSANRSPNPDLAQSKLPRTG
jgi:DNA-binding NarL/FixJ family response regulator